MSVASQVNTQNKTLCQRGDQNRNHSKKKSKRVIETVVGSEIAPSKGYSYA
jgi:hypothetical protein